MNEETQELDPKIAECLNDDNVLCANTFSFTVLINPGSGTVSVDSVKDNFKRSGAGIKVSQYVTLSHDEPLEKQVEDCFKSASNNDHGVVVVGGDGTINLAVKYAILHGVPLAVMARGTFNLFARHHGLSVDPQTQVQQLGECVLQAVAVSYVNDLPFTTSASFGLYPEVIQDRERHQAQAGFRSQLVAYLSGVVTFFKKRRRMRFTIERQNGLRSVKALLLMATQNKPHLDNLGFDDLSQRIDGHIALVVIRPEGIWDKMRLLIKGSVKLLEQDQMVDSELLDSVLLDCKSDKLKCALDGEVISLKTPIRIRVSPKALALFKPL